LPPVILGPRCNRRVSCDFSPANARSESAIAVNPLNPYNIIGASKRFTNPARYEFSLAAYFTFDGGESWNEAPPLALSTGWAGTSDPAVAWDSVGNAYLVGLPFAPGAGVPTIGIAVYKSSDGGRTWGSPNLIHSSVHDDKQWAAGDISPTSPHYGNVYTAWDDGSNLCFARSTNHGLTWKGTGTNPVGTVLATDSFSPEISVAADGTIYIVWLGGNQIKFVKSTDGGNSFSGSKIAASGITSLSESLPDLEGWAHFPRATFRVMTLATGCTGSGRNLIFAWADGRDIVSGNHISHIYYRNSSDGGNTWLGPGSGQRLLTGSLSSAANRHEFHPQLIATPNGEIGCAFYEFGAKGSGEFPPDLIDVILAVSTNNGTSFGHRVTVTDLPWDPDVDAPIVHDTRSVTFIGDYFGLDASRLGFFPFWTDTRTGVQEIFTSRISVNPADVYLRDSSSDLGNLPSPGFHWEYPDLIVRRRPDGHTTFVNEDLLRDGITNHYIYARVTNRGPNTGRNVRLAVIVANWPNSEGLPGSEFRYPQDWYRGDWNIPYIRNNRLDLGESSSTPQVNIGNGDTKIIGPVIWRAAQIPDPHGSNPWHPCILAEVRADNDDSAGGVNGCDIDADPDPCKYGSYFWGNNNVSQRNLSYGTVTALTAAHIVLPFLVGSIWSGSKFLEVIVDKGRELASTPMKLRMVSTQFPPETSEPSCGVGEIVFIDKCKVLVRTDNCDIGEIITAPGTVWRAHYPASAAAGSPVVYGAEKTGTQEWILKEPRAAVGFAITPGEIKRLELSFITPLTLKAGTSTIVRIYQRNDRKVITGSVALQLEISQSDKNIIRKRRKHKA
jgi:hypothetical protein